MPSARKKKPFFLFDADAPGLSRHDDAPFIRFIIRSDDDHHFILRTAINIKLHHSFRHPDARRVRPFFFTR